MSTNETLIARAQKVLLQNYKQQPIVLVRGQGTRVWDADGNEYLDLLGGIATCALGHCHPEVAKAAHAQLDTLWHTSNAFYTEPQVRLAEALVAVSGLKRVFFCNSGAEANEAAIKLARRVMKDRGSPDRFEIISFENSFHGRTLATLTATGQPKYQKGFSPLPAGFRHVPYGDLSAVAAAIGASTAAVLVETVQGEGGVRVPEAGFLAGLRQLCTQRGLLLMVDEVQTGMGRTGRFFGFMHEDIRPDVVTMAKALGNGLPIGAMLCDEEVGKSLPAGTHGSTFGGNPVAAAAANVAVELIRQPEFLAEVVRKGALLRERLLALQARSPGKVLDVRGQGLLVGVEVGSEASAVLLRCRAEGLLLNLAGERTVRFAPPLSASDAELDLGVERFARAL